MHHRLLGKMWKNEKINFDKKAKQDGKELLCSDNLDSIKYFPILNLCAWNKFGL